MDNFRPRQELLREIIIGVLSAFRKPREQKLQIEVNLIDFSLGRSINAIHDGACLLSLNGVDAIIKYLRSTYE